MNVATGCVLALLGATACQRTPETSPFNVSIGTRGCVIEQLTNEPYDEYQVQGVSRDGRWLSYAWSEGEDSEANLVRGSFRMNLVTGERVAMADVGIITIMLRSPEPCTNAPAMPGSDAQLTLQGPRLTANCSLAHKLPTGPLVVFLLARSA